MFSLLSQTPAPGFSKVSQAQVLRADRHSFVRMGELANGSLKATAAGVRPLDAILEQLHTDVSVTYFLLPTPANESAPMSKPQSEQSNKGMNNRQEPFSTEV